jgi:archaellum component FlaC
MMRNWKVLLGLPAVVTAALVAVPTAATAGGQPDKESVLEKLKTMDKALENSFKTIGDEFTSLKGDAITIKNRLKDLQEKLVQVQKDLDRLTTEPGDGKVRPETSRSYYGPADKAVLDEIKARLTRIEQDLAKLTTTRTAFSPAPTGRVRLVNDYVEDLLFIVRGRAYRVTPGSVQVVEQVPAGEFTYEVVSPTYGLRRRTTTGLAAGETFTISAR